MNVSVDCENTVTYIQIEVRNRMMHRTLSFLVLIATVVTMVVIAGCGGGGSSSGGDPVDDGGPTEWTIMVFMNADNDLEYFSVDNIKQMQRVGSTSRVKIVVQWDRHPDYSTADGNWTGTRRYEITRGGKTLLADIGEANMGDPQTLTDFIGWAQQNYPAAHYCLVIWNHGNGWRSPAPEKAPVTRSISHDATSGATLSTMQLPGILSSAPTPIDLLAMDACLMQMIEVAYELEGTSGYLVASEDSQTGLGYPYDRWLSSLVSNPTMTPADLGRNIAEKYVQAYSGNQEVVQSVVDLSKAPGVAFALDRFAGTVLPLARLSASQLAAARRNSLLYFRDESYYDLQDYAYNVSRTLANTQVTQAYDSLAAAIDAAVVYVGYGGSDMSRSHGLSIWVPDPASYRASSYDYRNLKLSQDTRWDEFLAAQTQ